MHISSLLINCVTLCISVAIAVVACLTQCLLHDGIVPKQIKIS